MGSDVAAETLALVMQESTGTDGTVLARSGAGKHRAQISGTEMRAVERNTLTLRIQGCGRRRGGGTDRRNSFGEDRKKGESASISAGTSRFRPTDRFATYNDIQHRGRLIWRDQFGTQSVRSASSTKF